MHGWASPCKSFDRACQIHSALRLPCIGFFGTLRWRDSPQSMVGKADLGWCRRYCSAHTVKSRRLVIACAPGTLDACIVVGTRTIEAGGSEAEMDIEAFADLSSQLSRDGMGQRFLASTSTSRLARLSCTLLGITPFAIHTELDQEYRWCRVVCWTDP